MSNVTALPTRASRGASGAPAGSWRRTSSSGGAGLLSTDGGERGQPGLHRVDGLGVAGAETPRPVRRVPPVRARSGARRPAPGRCWSTARRAPRARRRARAPRGSRRSRSARRRGAADRFASGGRRSRRRPRLRPAPGPARRRRWAGTRRTPRRPFRRRGTRVPRARRPCAAPRRRARARGRRAGARVPVDERERVRVGQRALRGAELHRPCSRRDGDEVGAHRVGAAGSDLNAHRVARRFVQLDTPRKMTPCPLNSEREASYGLGSSRSLSSSRCARRSRPTSITGRTLKPAWPPATA